MEPVPAHPVLLVPLVGQGVEVRLLGHGLVPGRVHDRDVRDAGEGVFGGLDAGFGRGAFPAVDLVTENINSQNFFGLIRRKIFLFAKLLP